MMDNTHKIACYVLTHSGLNIAQEIAKNIKISIFTSKRLSNAKYVVFDSLQKCVEEHFFKFNAHIFVTASGIAVRCIAAHLGHKSSDPAVVVCDQQGKFVISLLSGHWGGANNLTKHIAQVLGARPIITTATDVENVPSIDTMVRHYNYTILDWDKVKIINMALLEGQKIQLFDPMDMLDVVNVIDPTNVIGIANVLDSQNTIGTADETDSASMKPLHKPKILLQIKSIMQLMCTKGCRISLPRGSRGSHSKGDKIAPVCKFTSNYKNEQQSEQTTAIHVKPPTKNSYKNYFVPISQKQINLSEPTVSIHWKKIAAQPNLLRICTPTLHVGIGFRQHISSDEILKALEDTFNMLNLEIKSIASLASVSIKQDEPTLHTLSKKLQCKLAFFNPEELSKIPILSPSNKAAQLFNVPQISVCEGSALLSAGNNSILISKKIKYQHIITLAIAANKNIVKNTNV